MPSTAIAFPLRLRLHYKAARVGGDMTLARSLDIRAGVLMPVRLKESDERSSDIRIQ